MPSLVGSEMCIRDRVESHHRDKDHQAWPQQQLWVGPDKFLGIIDHHPPFRGGRAHTQAQKGQPRDVQHHVTNVHRGQNQQLAHYSGHHVLTQTGQTRSPGQARSQHIVTIALGTGLSNVCLLYTSPSPRD